MPRIGEAELRRWREFSIAAFLSQFADHAKHDTTFVPTKSKTTQSGLAKKTAPMTTEEYLKSLAPRIKGLQHTAPRYDEVTKPLHAPVIVGCVIQKRRCQCYNQQGARYPADFSLCENIANGNNPYYDFISPPVEASGLRTGAEGATGGEMVYMGAKND